jgi:hypothetical protein
VKKIADLHGKRSVTIGDKDAEALIRQGKIGIVDVSAMMIADSEQDAQKPAPRRAKTAKEAATARTVATPRMGGG